MPGLFTRRVFFAGFGLSALSATRSFGENPDFMVRRLPDDPGDGIAFQAIAAASMPETLVIEGAASHLIRANYMELRRYRFERLEHHVLAREVFVRHAIPPLLSGQEGTFLFAFATLEEREKAWRQLAPDEEWVELQPNLEDLAVYARLARRENFGDVVVEHKHHNHH